MKKILNITYILCLVTLFIGCTKDNLYPSTIAIEAFPSITLNGGEVMVLSAGQTFADPGATVHPGYDDKGNLLSDTSTLTYSIKASEAKIGTAEGIYFVKYTYRNFNGFETTAKRKVVVVNQAYTSNYAGQWKRTNNVVNTWKNLGNGVHEISDPGGVGAEPHKSDKLYIIIKNDNTVICPEQEVPSTHVTVSALTNVSFTPTQVKYTIIANGAYGTAVRTFNKQ